MPKGKSKRKQGAGKVSKPVKKYVEKKLKKAAEMKQVEYSNGAVTISNISGTRYLLNNVDVAGNKLSTGALPNQRIGSKIKIYGFDVRADIRILNLATSKFESVRAIVIMEKQPEGIPFASAELFISTGTGVTIQSGYNEKHKHRFKILYDKTYNLNDFSPNVAGTGCKKDIVIHKRYKRPFNCTFYSDPTGILNGTSALEQCAIYFFLISQGSNTQAEQVVYNIVYTDA